MIEPSGVVVSPELCALLGARMSQALAAQFRVDGQRLPPVLEELCSEVEAVGRNFRLSGSDQSSEWFRPRDDGAWQTSSEVAALLGISQRAVTKRCSRRKLDAHIEAGCWRIWVPDDPDRISPSGVLG